MKAEHILKNVNRHITKPLTEQERVALVITGKKLRTKFDIKDKICKEPRHGLT